MVETKAIEQLLPINKIQAINYCEAYHIADGLLINFGAMSLEFKRFYNKYIDSQQSIYFSYQSSKPQHFRW